MRRMVEPLIIFTVVLVGGFSITKTLDYITGLKQTINYYQTSVDKISDSLIINYDLQEKSLAQLNECQVKPEIIVPE